jgi:uncharacterized membrane protein YkgB
MFQQYFNSSEKSGYSNILIYFLYVRLIKMSGKSFYLAKSPLIPSDVEHMTMLGTSLSLAGAINGTVYISPSPVTTSYTLTLPNAQGSSLTFLKNDGSGALTWSPAVIGPATSTDNAIARFDSTTGSLLQNSSVTISDTADVAGVKTLTMSDATSGTLTVQPAAATTSYALTLPAAQGVANTFIKNNGSGTLTWSPAVIGPATATDNAITRFDSTTGSLVQNSSVTVSDTADVAGVKTLTMNGATSGTLTMQPAATTISYTLTLPATQGFLNYFLRNDGAGNLSWAAPATYVAGNFFFGDIGGGTSGPIATAGDFTSCTKTNGTFGNGASYFVVTWTPRSSTPKSFAANYYSIGSTNSDDNDIMMPFMTAISDGSITLVCEETSSTQNTGMMLTIFY